MEVVFKNFQEDILKASYRQPIVVDFWAEWCAPCRMLSPTLEKLAREASGKWRLVKINTEEHPQLSMEWGITSIPAVKLFHEGKVISEFLGALPEHAVVKWLNENIPTEAKKSMELATQLIERGDFSKAIKILQQTIAEDPSFDDAKILLAKLIVEDQPEKAMSLVSAVDESHPQYKNAETVKTLGRLMTNNLAVDGNNSESWQLYVTRIEAFKKRNYRTALESWIEVNQIDRDLDDDGARKACVALFNLLGKDHELTKEYHRRFTSALF